MTELCQWRYLHLPDSFGVYVWCCDPQPLYSCGGVGIVVGKLSEVTHRKGRSTERLTLLKRTRSAKQVGWNLHGGCGENGQARQFYSEPQIRRLVLKGMDSEVILESQAQEHGRTLFSRIGTTVRVVDGGRVGREGDSVPVSEGPGRPAIDRDVKLSWRLVTGSSDQVRFRVDGERNAVRFGQVQLLSHDGSWKTLTSDPNGRYLFSADDPAGDSQVFRMTLDELISGIVF